MSKMDPLHLAIQAAQSAGAGMPLLESLLNLCEDAECFSCGAIMCPLDEPMHYHHDGCPACSRLETVALQMPPDPGPDPTKLEYDDWIARTRECPACQGQGCEAHETDDGRLVCGSHCERCEGAGRIPH